MQKTLLRIMLAFTFLLCFVYSPNLYAESTITFEEDIPQPDNVLSQYCNNAETNMGVSFLDSGGRIFQPSVQTHSPTHALSNNFPGDEFGEYKTLKMSFTAAQSLVSVKVGLDRAYSFPVTAILHAYSSDTPGTGYLKFSTTYLGSGATSITHDLSLASTAGDIRSVIIEFSGPSSGDQAYEIIDQLSYSTVGPPCVDDEQSPAVSIQTPQADGQIVQSAHSELAFYAQDSETGIAAVQVQFLDDTQNTLDDFYVCGGSGGQPCIYDVYPFSVHYDFHTFLPEHTKTIRVRAWDFAGHSAQANRQIQLVPIGDQMNLWAQAMEINQAIQPWLPSNDYQTRLSDKTPITFKYPDVSTSDAAVPLVADRTTVVRVYPGVEDVYEQQSLKDVRAVLRCYTDSGYTQPCPAPSEISPCNQPPDILPEITVDPAEILENKRGDISSSLNFVLPSQWTAAGTVHLEAEIQGPIGLTECKGCQDAANRIRVTDVTFHSLPDFASDLIHFVQVRREVDSAVHTPTQSEMDNHTTQLARRYPLDETAVHTKPDTQWTLKDDLKLELGTRCGRVTGLLAKSFPSKAGKMAVYGLVDTGYDCAGMGGGGYAYGRGNRPDTFAHEVGHALGLNHAGPPPGHGAECSTGGSCDDWPWPHGTFPGYGFDILDMKVIVPGTAEADPHDIMSYGGGLDWISSRNWTRIFNVFNQSDYPYPEADASSLERDSRESSRSDYLIVRGEYQRGSGWGLQPAFEVSLPQGTSDAVGQGIYSLTLYNARSQPLFTRSFSLPDSHVDLDDAQALEPVLGFQEVLPLPDGAVFLVLTQEEQGVLDVLERSACTPVVEIISPTSRGFATQEGQPIIQWEGSDGDRDPLRYMVQYITADQLEAGQEWTTLGSDLNEPELLVDPQELPGGEANVRVLATDGFNTAAALSEAFQVAHKPPQPQILWPQNNDIVGGQRDRVVLRGTASDLEDGLLSTGNLYWYSSRDGLLGRGRRIEVQGLTPGTHELTLVAEDSHGLTAEAEVGIEVMEHLNTQPVADAGADRATLPGIPVLLDGSGSADLDNDPLVFNWSIQSSPPGSSPVLLDAQTEHPQFVAEEQGQYECALVVHDGQVESLKDRVLIQVTADACPGDFDRDGDVDGRDLSTFSADFGRTDCADDCEGDFDRDGDVDGMDLAVFSSDFGRTDCP